MTVDIKNLWKTTLDEDIEDYIIKTDSKDDGGKPRLDLVPPVLIEAVGHVMTHGVEKYSEDSWKTVEAKRYRAALMRHLMAYLRNPIGRDKDSGMFHLWHVACNVAFLLVLDGLEVE